MTYQYGQGFDKDLKSFLKVIKNENSIDFDNDYVTTEIKKILKYNKSNEDTD